MKVIFLTHMTDQGHRFRVEQYFPFLRTHQVEPVWQPIRGTLRERFSIYRQLPAYEIVCIQRRLVSPLEFYWIRRQSKKVLFDLDDAVMYRSSRSTRPHSFSRWLKFKRMVRGSDVITAGNEFLKEQVLRADPGKEVFLVPTPIDTRLYPKKKEVSDRPEFLLGWIGTKGNLRYLEKLEPVFESLSRRFSHVRLKIVSNDFFESRHLPVIKKPWRLEDENEDLISFDVGLMPLSDDPWSKGKCGLKILQYLSVGVPVVCTPVGINRDIVRHGENGFWAVRGEEWVDRITDLIQSAELRRRMGLRGIETVEEGYSLSVTSEKLLKILRYLRDGGPAA